MAIQKLIIEYVSDNPIFPPDHFKMETNKPSYLGWKYLFDFLHTFSSEGIITPIYPDSLKGSIDETTPKYKRTQYC